MKIAIISPNPSAYSETFIQKHIDLLVGEKHVFSSGNIPTTLNGKLLWDSDKLKEILRNWVLRKFKLPLRTRSSVFSEELHSLQPNVILCEYLNIAATNISIIAENKINLIVHCHGYDVHNTEVVKPLYNEYQKVFNYAKVIFYVSKDMGKQLHQLGCPNEKLVYNPYGPDPDFFGVKPNLSSNFLLAVGRFSEKKAPFNTILAFSEALKQLPELKLNMAGDGHLLNASLLLVKSLGIEHAVEFLGAISPDQIKAEMAKSACFIQHSMQAPNGDSEGTPVGILEAQAAGLPVISTQHTGIKEAVKHSETGYLVNEGDISGMANSIIRFFQLDKEIKQRLSNNAKEHIRLNYTLEQHISNIQSYLS